MKNRIKSLIADAALYSGHYLGQASGVLKAIGVNLHIKFGTETGKQAEKYKDILKDLTNYVKSEQKGKYEQPKITIIGPSSGKSKS